MPRFLARAFYAMRGKRRVRLHLDGDNPSIEGVMVGRWAGHYVLIMPRLIKGADDELALEGTAEVPVGRVVFVQVIA